MDVIDREMPDSRCAELRDSFFGAIESVVPLRGPRWKNTESIAEQMPIRNYARSGLTMMGMFESASAACSGR